MIQRRNSSSEGGLRPLARSHRSGAVMRFNLSFLIVKNRKPSRREKQTLLLPVSSVGSYSPTGSPLSAFKTRYWNTASDFPCFTNEITNRPSEYCTWTAEKSRAGLSNGIFLSTRPDGEIT